MKILLVDDDLDDREAFAEMVGKLNLSIDLIQAGDSTELFEYLENDPNIHLIFQDINMPKKDGRQCLKELKSNDRYKHIPVIMYTISSSEEDINYVYENGAHYYIVKPYANINFLETLRRVFTIDWTIDQPVPSREDFIINMAFT